MPRTVDEGFRDFVSKLTPSSSESAAAASHRASIEACLNTNFGVERFFRTGSFGNGTSISSPSSSSTTSLTKVRDALDKRFPATGVRVSCPAVMVPFGSLAKESTEVVPADLAVIPGKLNVYVIATGAHELRP